ncbi:MAG: ribosomal protein S18-alanine N-acetyltransferase [Pseudanabaenaceae cyanobacterium bins.68]|nr:ribosomal protein S18-alanine N-acetyltransferase [Pseudanabaenaceae cyanobacterium bins.68]
MTKTIYLQAAIAAMVPAIVALDQECLGGFWSASAYLAEIERDHSQMLVISNQAEILGFVCAWSVLEEAHLIMLVVAPSDRRRGLGKAMVWAILAWARAHGSEWVTLEVRKSNLQAIRLYQFFGFGILGERRNYYQNPPEDALILWRKEIQTLGFYQALVSWHSHIHGHLRAHQLELVAGVEWLQGF